MPGATDVALFDAFTGTGAGFVIPMPSLAGDRTVGQLRYLGPRGLTADTNTLFAGNGFSLSAGTGGAMTAAPFLLRGNFATRTGLDNLTVRVTPGTSFVAGSAGESLGGVEISGQANNPILRNGAGFRLSNGSGATATNYALTLTTGAQLSFLNAGTIDTGYSNPASRQQAVQFQGGALLTLQGANAPSSTDVTTPFTLNGLNAQSGAAVLNVAVGSNLSTGQARTQLNLGVGTAQPGFDRFIRNAAGAVVGFGGGTVELQLGDTIAGTAGLPAARGRGCLPPSAAAPTGRAARPPPP